MSVTLDQILALAGRVDDSRDFDAPRERFRRFLREHITDITTLRTFVDQAKYSPDDQHRRAMQDLVVLLGKFLGFDVDIGAPSPSSGAPTYHGTWHAPGRLRVIVEVGTLTSAPSAAAAYADEPSSGTPVVYLFVPVSLPPARRGSDAGHPSRSLRIMPIGELISLAEMATTGRLGTLEVMRMLEMGIPVDFVSNLLDRPDAATAVVAPETTVEPIAPAPQRGSGFWMASVAPDYATTPEEFLEVVVARRHVFGVTDRGTVVGTVHTGDGICFYLPGKGVVGHAWVESIVDGASELRDPRRFRQVLRLDRLSLHLAKPANLDLETELRLRAAPATANRHAQMLLEISAESFRTFSEPAVRYRPTERHEDEDPPLPGHGRLSG